MVNLEVVQVASGQKLGNYFKRLTKRIQTNIDPWFKVCQEIIDSQYSHSNFRLR